MPEHIRSLIVILAIALTIFFFAKPHVSELLANHGEFERRRNLWVAITLAAFLAHNFWIFMFIGGLLLCIAAQNDKDKLGLVLFVLLAIPLIKVEIPGIAGIRYIIDFDYFRLISLTVIVPAVLLEAKHKKTSENRSGAPDKLLYAYLLLNIALIYLAGSLTGALRTGISNLLDFVFPYLFASRFAQSYQLIRAAVTSYVIGASVIAGIGTVEFLKSWLLYSSLENALGVDWGYGSYLKREGILRAMGTSGQAIPFGYTMAVGFCLALGLGKQFKSKTAWGLCLCLLTMGMIASYSRGPWVGAAVGVLAFILASPNASKNVLRLCLVALVLGPILALSPLGDKLFQAATVESGNFDYRQRVFEVSIGVIMNNPLFGAWNAVYAPAMQELKQGQGIIDIVNTYIAIGLRSGLLGLSLFAGFFIVICIRLWRKFRSMGKENEALQDIGRGLFSTLACILTTIATVSSITFIPIVYYLIAGLSVSFLYISSTAPDKPEPLSTETVSPSKRHFRTQN